MRYDRQIILPEIGWEGQEKLKQSRVLIVGVGGLGSPIALYLAGAGIGTIGLVDDDLVSISNLQRQVLYSEAEIGQVKVFCAQCRLQQLNSEICIQTHPVRLNRDNAVELINQYDIVVDGCDNFSTRYLINDTCLALGKIYVYGAISEFGGQVSVFNHQGGADYRKLFPNETEMLNMPPPPKGVMGITPGVIGSLEANEVIKVVCGFGDTLSGKLLTFNLRNLESNIFSL